MKWKRLPRPRVYLPLPARPAPSGSQSGARRLPARRLPAAPDPGVRLPRTRSPRRGPAMAKRSSLSIRIVEGKNLPAKDM